jgi:hypothetical protein
MSFSTSVSVRYSRLRSSLFDCRLGVTARFFGGWRNQLQVRFGHGFRLLAINDCSYNTHITSSVRGNLAMMVSGFYRLAVVIRSADSGVSSRKASLHDGHALGKRHVFGEIGQCAP